jgi:hypothetical protein
MVEHRQALGPQFLMVDISYNANDLQREFGILGVGQLLPDRVLLTKETTGQRFAEHHSDQHRARWVSGTRRFILQAQLAPS